MTGQLREIALTEVANDITRLLVAHHEGDRGAFDQLMPLVYDELRRIARRQLSGHRFPETLNATAVVHEAYFQLVDETQVPWANRAHFFAIAARSMRRILIDYARQRQAKKRGGDQVHVELDPNEIAVLQQAESLIALDEALSSLDDFAPRMARVAECKLFAGLADEEIAEALESSLRTVQREWQRARAWLQRELTSASA